MRWKKKSKCIKVKETMSYFPKFALRKKDIIDNFESDDVKLYRDNLILNKMDLPFVHGYLYSYNGNYFTNKDDLEVYNELLFNNQYVLDDKGAYSVDGRYFKNVELAKKYNDNLVDYYYRDFGWIQEEVCEYNLDDIMMLKLKK